MRNASELDEKLPSALLAADHETSALLDRDRARGDAPRHRREKAFESGCFHFFGKSSEGKTTCLLLSRRPPVWGLRRRRRQLCSDLAGDHAKRGSKRFLRGLATHVSRSTNSGRSRGRELGQALYMATGGVGKQRMRRDATLKPLSSVWARNSAVERRVPRLRRSSTRTQNTVRGRMRGNWCGPSIFR